MATVNGYTGNTPAATTPVATGSKQPAPPSKTVDSQSVLKRFFLFYIFPILEYSRLHLKELVFRLFMIIIAAIVYRFLHVSLGRLD